MKHCLNCDAVLQEAQNFCACCGQKAATHRIGWHDLIHDAIHYFTHADKGIFTLIKQLAIQPGLVIREYLSGKRKKYFSPFNFFLIAAALYVISYNYFNHTGKAIKSTQVEANAPQANPAPGREMSREQIGRSAETQAFFEQHSKWLAIISLPLTAFIYWLFYKRGGLSFTEHLVANMFINGFTLLSMAFLFFTVGKWLFPQSLQFIFFLLVLQVVYFAFAYYQFTNQRGLKHFAYALIAAITSIIVWTALVMGFTLWYVHSGLSGLLS